MGLSSPGIGSGLDVKGMVDAMVKADIAKPQLRHDKKLESVNTDLSAIGQLKSALSNLQSTLSDLSNISQFYKMKNSISEPGYFSATVTEQASPGVYQIQVQALAQAQSLASGYFANNATTVGSGHIAINFGTYSSDKSTFTANTDATPVSITIASGSDSLTAICDAINAADSDVSACIVQDSLGSRLSLTSKTGVNYAMQITSDIAALNYDPTTSNTPLTQTMAAQNSLVQINGMILNQNSNQLNNALTGISLNLKQADTNQTISLTVENNQEQLTNSVHDFVKKYNDVMTFLNNVTNYNKETKKPGYFQGDSQIKNLKLNLYQTIANFKSASSSSGELLTLADIGINTTKTCLLEIDEEAFSKAVAANYSSIGALFAKTVNATDPAIKINSVDTKASAGAYDVLLSEFTPGVSMSGSIGGLPATSTDGVTLIGNGNLSSLSVNVLAGNAGNRGQILVNDGLAVLMDQMLDKYIGKQGEFDQRTQTLDKKVSQLAKTQEQIVTRSDTLTKKYMKQWNAVDLLISDLQSTSGMLTQLLTNLSQLKV